MKNINIAVLGTCNSEFRPHRVLSTTLQQAALHLGIEIKPEWIATDKLNDLENAFGLLKGFHGIWCSPGSPYKSLTGALNGIRFARENDIPFIGTCAGFQHLILEYARNILGYTEANSEEYKANGQVLFITPLKCALTGQTLHITIREDTLAHRIWGQTQIREHYYCRFGLNPEYLPQIQESDLVISGTDKTHEPRIVELPGHPFFIGTLFVPGDEQLFDGQPNQLNFHPLIKAFAGACLQTEPAVN